MKTAIITVTAITAEEKKRQYARGAISKMVGDKRVCVVCGAEYISHHPKQLCCCKACSKANYKNAPSHTREAKRMQQRRRTEVFCKICGKKIYRTMNPDQRASTSRYHVKCTIMDMINTINSGQRYSRAQFQRVSSRGYSVFEVRAWADEYSRTGKVKELEGDLFCEI